MRGWHQPEDRWGRGGVPCVLERGGATGVKRLIPESLLAPGPPGYFSGGFPAPLRPSAPERDAGLGRYARAYTHTTTRGWKLQSSGPAL